MKRQHDLGRLAFPAAPVDGRDHDSVGKRHRRTRGAILLACEMNRGASPWLAQAQSRLPGRMRDFCRTKIHREFPCQAQYAALANATGLRLPMIRFMPEGNAELRIANAERMELFRFAQATALIVAVDTHQTCRPQGRPFAQQEED
jgi:hypothetical protein